MPDDIAYWRAERAKLYEQLNQIESGVLENASLPFIRYLKTRISDLDRHIAGLEKRRDAQGS